MAVQDNSTLDQMQMLITRWQAASDQRAVFLSCYHLMTASMLAALREDEFHDPAWVEQLLYRFADYYFAALEAYESDPAGSPAAWRLAFSGADQPHLNVLQKLLLGVNAHINYDLALALYDVLAPDWPAFNPEQRTARHSDHCQVNRVIAATVDAAQTQIVEPSMPVLVLFDRLLGPVDELLTSRLISAWRDTVWRNATRLLETSDLAERAEIVAAMEREALRIGDLIA
jgi:hypothetical protein